MPVPDPGQRVDLPMVCTCGAEREAAGEQLYQRVKAALSRGSAGLKAREITDRSFVDDLLLSLLADHGATVEAVHGDQWFAVVVESFDADNEEVQVVCQCDSPTLGLCAIWEWYETGGPIPEAERAAAAAAFDDLDAATPPPTPPDHQEYQ